MGSSAVRIFKVAFTQASHELKVLKTIVMHEFPSSTQNFIAFSVEASYHTRKGAEAAVS